MQDQALSDNEAVADQDATNMTISQIRAQRVQSLSGQTKEPAEETPMEPEAEEEEEVKSKEDTESEPEDEAAEQEEESEEESNDDEPEDVLSQIDWESLDEDTKIAIAQEVGSGAGKRIGQLTSEIKTLKEELTSKDKAIEDGLGNVVLPNNSFADVVDAEKLDEQEKILEQDVQYFEDWISGDDDLWIHPQTNQEFTRKEISGFLKDWRGKLRDIPKQRDYIGKLGKAKENAKKFREKAEAELDWIHDENSKQHNKYTELVSDSDLAVLEKFAPMVAAKFKYIAAHAANSLSQPTKKIKLKRKAGTAPQSTDGAAASVSQGAKESKKVKELQARARNGDIRAARELRLTQINQRLKR